MKVTQIKVAEAVAGSAFILKEEPTKLPPELDVGHERQTESNMTPRFLTQAGRRMKWPSIEEKVIGEAAWRMYGVGAGKKSGVQVEC